MSVTKECRPKSALRRKAVKADRDLDLTEGEENTAMNTVALQEYTDMLQFQTSENTGISCKYRKYGDQTFHIETFQLWIPNLTTEKFWSFHILDISYFCHFTF